MNFPNPGVVQVFCHIHADMSAVVLVLSVASVIILISVCRIHAFLALILAAALFLVRARGYFDPKQPLVLVTDNAEGVVAGDCDRHGDDARDAGRSGKDHAAVHAFQAYAIEY